MNRRIRSPLAFLAAVLGAGSPRPATAQESAPAQKPLTAEQAIQPRNISDLRFAPDGKVVALVVTEPPAGSTRLRHIWMLDATSHDLRQFTNSAKSEDTARW